MDQSPAGPDAGVADGGAGRDEGLPDSGGHTDAADGDTGEIPDARGSDSGPDEGPFDASPADVGADAGVEEEPADGGLVSCDGIPHGGSRECGPEKKGECRPGKELCNDGQWGSCEGATWPGQEICGNGLDENCDGTADDGCKPDCATPGRITVDLEGSRIFDRSGLAKSLRCLGLEFVSDQYGSGPPGATIKLDSSVKTPPRMYGRDHM